MRSERPLVFILILIEDTERMYLHTSIKVSILTRGSPYPQKTASSYFERSRFFSSLIISESSGSCSSQRLPSVVKES
ncbi:hypothetical protein Q428_13130 [Fervidicella metallireducens AeB]|uniref:Uncharacterized protein n=1 Tax=Fervidicella metallireducens AeB TaxID=1403537 RepID=A0A017RS71_9CLOT|nr:hypothetical protein Q428_13130 [Fervidicella metallireducens AeB]